jgi:hypothetical protein
MPYSQGAGGSRGRLFRETCKNSGDLPSPDEASREDKSFAAGFKDALSRADEHWKDNPDHLVRVIVPPLP